MFYFLSYKEKRNFFENKKKISQIWFWDQVVELMMHYRTKMDKIEFRFGTIATCT